jgi:hypothetical protein
MEKERTNCACQKPYPILKKTVSQVITQSFKLSVMKKIFFFPVIFAASHFIISLHFNNRQQIFRRQSVIGE